MRVPGWTIAGRPVKPVPLALVLSLTVLAWINIFDTGGALLDGVEQTLIGWTAAVALVLLIWGWIRFSARMMRYGLLVATGIWAARTAFVGITLGIDFYGFWLNLAWVIVSGGTYLLEAQQPDRMGKDMRLPQR